MSKVKKPRYKLLHQYYKYTGFYGFIWEGVKKAILPTVIVVAILFYINYEIKDWFILPKILVIYLFFQSF